MHDHRSSNVPVETAPAVAAVLALGQRLCFDRSTFRARLRSSPRIDLHQLDTSSCSLVFEHSGQLRPRGIVNVLGQHPGCEALHVQVFDRDTAKTVDQIAGNLVQVVAPLGCDAGVESGEGRLALRPRRGAALAPSNRALAAAQLTSSTLRPVRAWHGLAGAQRHKAGEAEVDADAIRAGAILRLNLDVEDDVPFASLPRQDRRLRLAGQLAVPPHLDLAGHADEAELAGLADRKAVADAELGSVKASTGTKAREAWFVAALEPGKERFERLVKTAENLLFGSERPAGESRSSTANGLQLVGLHLVGHRHLPTAPCIDALFQSGVIELAEVAEHFPERSGLRPVRLDAVFVAQDHRLLALLRFDVTADSCFGNGADSGYEIGFAPQRRQTRAQM